MAMEMEGQGEPALKRPRLTKIWYTLNQGSVQFVHPTQEMMVAELAQELHHPEAIVKHKGVLLCP